MENSNRSTVTTVVVVAAILIILVLAAILLPRYFGGDNTGVLMNLPEIETPIISATDGSTHTVSAYFTLELGDVDQEDVDSSTISAAIKSIMSDMDFDQIASEGNVDYIKDEIKNGLAAQGLDEYVQNLYLRDLSSGDQKIISPETQSGNSNLIDVFDGLNKSRK